MHLLGLKRKLVAVAAVFTGLAAAAIGFATPANASIPWEPPPGYYWMQISSSCESGVPSGDPLTTFVSFGPRCEMLGGGAGAWVTTYVLMSNPPANPPATPPAPADNAPVGYLDGCDAATISGWAKDPDWTGSLDVHVYTQNGALLAATASAPSEPGTMGTNQRFAVAHGQPSGTVLTVYAIGRDAAGNLNAVNPPLPLSTGSGTSCIVP